VVSSRNSIAQCRKRNEVKPQRGLVDSKLADKQRSSPPSGWPGLPDSAWTAAKFLAFPPGQAAGPAAATAKPRGKQQDRPGRGAAGMAAMAHRSRPIHHNGAAQAGSGWSYQAQREQDPEIGQLLASAPPKAMPWAKGPTETWLIEPNGSSLGLSTWTWSRIGSGSCLRCAR